MELSAHLAAEQAPEAVIASGSSECVTGASAAGECCRISHEQLLDGSHCPAPLPLAQQDVLHRMLESKRGTREGK